MTSPIYTALFDAIDAAMDNVADMDTTRQDYAKAATEAAMKACGPRELVWTPHPTIAIWRCDTGYGTYKVFGVGDTPSWDFDSERTQLSTAADTIKAAKAAAQAHADAAHWANTVIGAGAAP